MKELTIVLVAYNNEEEVVTFFRRNSDPERTEHRWIIVVNGCKHRAPLESVRESNCSVLWPEKNLGYLGALLFAFSSTERKCHWILCNTDMDLEVPSIFDELTGGLDAKTSVTGPRILSMKDGRQQNPFLQKRMSKGKLRYLRFVYRFYILYVMHQLISLALNFIRGKRSSAKSAPERVYALHGSFLCLNTHFMPLLLSHTDCMPFLYSEELFLAELSLRYGMQMNYLPRYTVFHREHATTQTFKSRKHLRFFVNSLDRINKCFYS